MTFDEPFMPISPPLHLARSLLRELIQLNAPARHLPEILGGWEDARMTGENAHPEGANSLPEGAATPDAGALSRAAASPDDAAAPGKWMWAWPPILTGVLAVGVSIWGADFGVAAIAALGAWVVWVIAREAAGRAPALAVAIGIAAGVLLWLLCSQQSAYIFQSPKEAYSSQSATPLQATSGSGIACTAEVQRDPSEAWIVSVTGNVTGLPDAAEATTTATSNGQTLATQDSYPDADGVATINIALKSPPGADVLIRTEVRMGARIVQTCGW